ncbi:DUF3298 and DUF4163 domain-containing protein [Bacillus sp. S/N-304-OC-R1]|uniref:DUF3298 and DUF4163 domain-containing protein n=1 Tax=Bacillus sp. S/N-304-OC-R1 TaxID=2758034 RepID=UPI001C8CFB19|nr:DUF3298 and DUF4163 domain-containing protein [Bacillus sp. S/N-304-OC-R1]MBY0121106.1 DUF3298 domain-containing protein [Bacillus sp. S/N-304-OC-R1]
MNKKLEQLRTDYKNIEIPDELDLIVEKALKKTNKNRRSYKWAAGAAAAVILFIGSLNISPAMAHTLSEVPVVGSIVKVLTFTEFKVDENNYQADIKVPAIKDLENKDLAQYLNDKYLNEGKELYEQFMKDTEDLKESGGGHLGIDSGYEIKTDNDQILSIGRYVVNTAASSSTVMKYDTIDKINQILLSLPILFKDERYVDIISENIKEQMRTQMKEDSGKFYWVTDAGLEDEDLFETFDSIKKDQNFYINQDGKLVISFDKYEVSPGYMGIVEFVIPTEIINDILVSNEYIK